MGSLKVRLKNAFVVFAFFGANCAIADEYDEAVQAYASADYKKAYQLFLPLAESGDSDAQFHLGLMYDNGLGVKQDPKVAEKWYNRACPLPAETAQPK